MDTLVLEETNVVESTVTLPATHEDVRAIYATTFGTLFEADEKTRLADFDKKRILEEQYTILHVASGGHPFKGKLVILPNTDAAKKVVFEGSVMYFRNTYGFDKEVAKTFYHAVGATKFGREKRIQDLATDIINDPPPNRIRRHRASHDLKSAGYNIRSCSDARCVAATEIAKWVLRRRIIN